MSHYDSRLAAVATIFVLALAVSSTARAMPCGASVPGCFLMPYEATPEPASEEAQATARIDSVDAYVLIDRSGSMGVENDALKTNLANVADSLTCPPAGSGDPSNCVNDLWWGTGGIGYIGTGGEPYTNYADLNPSAATAASAFVTTEPAGCCDEPILLSTYSTMTGDGSADTTCSVANPYPARASCTGSPAGDSGFGYPCFRRDALSVLAIATDEVPSQTSNCPVLNSVGTAALSAGVWLVGIVGGGAAPAVTAELQQLAVASEALDSAGDPLVFSGSGADAPLALQSALLGIIEIPLDVSATLVDDPSDSIDVSTAFFDHIETRQLGTAECADGQADFDTNLDGLPDTYISVESGTPLCWLLVLRNNSQVEPASQEQVFPATLEIRGNGVLLAELPLSFVVPGTAGVPTVGTPGLIVLAFTVLGLGLHGARRRQPPVWRR